MYDRQEDIFNSIYWQLKSYGNEHDITNSASKQQISEFTSQIADLTQRRIRAWNNAMEHDEKYTQKSVKRNFLQNRVLRIRRSLYGLP